MLDDDPGDEALHGGAWTTRTTSAGAGGEDTISDHDWQGPDEDRVLVAADVLPAEVSVSREGGGLLLHIRGTADEMWLAGSHLTLRCGEDHG